MFMKAPVEPSALISVSSSPQCCSTHPPRVWKRSIFLVCCSEMFCGFTCMTSAWGSKTRRLLNGDVIWNETGMNVCLDAKPWE